MKNSGLERYGSLGRLERLGNMRRGIMDNTGRYGRLDRPEQKVYMDAEEDPVQAALSGYRLWLEIAARSGFRVYRPQGLFFYNYKIADHLYEEAKSLVRSKLAAFKGIEKSDMQKIVSGIETDDSNASGIYLSALLNETDIGEMASVLKHTIAGYRLGKERTLIALQGSDVADLGTHADGNIVNYGRVVNMSSDISSGVHLNFGYARFMARYALGGVLMNFGEVRSIPHWVNGGISLNFGEAHEINHPLQGGVQMNFGQCDRFSVSSIVFDHPGILLNFGIMREPHQFLDHIQRSKHYEKGIEEIRGQMREKAENFKSLDALKDFPEAAGRLLKTYGWKSFEEEMVRLGKELEELCV